MVGLGTIQRTGNNIQRQARVWQNDCSALCPPPMDPSNPAAAERGECDASLLKFLLHCSPEAFPLEMSPDHLRIIHEIEDRIIHGGLKAIAMPRGSGKTTIMLKSALWAILSGHRRFICLVAADETTAIDNLKSIKIDINHNEQINRLYDELGI